MEHLERMITEESIRIINESPKPKKNLEISQIKWSKLGCLSYLKPMIEQNKDVEIKMFEGIQAPEHCQFDEFQLELYGLLRNYKDLLYTNESLDNQKKIQQVYVLHILDHLINSRLKIMSNNKVFEKKTLSDNIIHDDPSLRDQGFTRARILFLLPFRYSALRLGKCIIETLGDNYNVANMDRFVKEFGDEDGVDSTLRPLPQDPNHPKDYYQTFHGNTDDAFRIGLKLTKKSIKFFADFYDSDIIIASPLGLKTIISPQEDQAIAQSSESREQIPGDGDHDFLSSIEITIMDQADVFLMQNWEHVLDVMEHINVMPKKPRKMDVSRIRPWHLENWSKYYRQLIMFTSVSVPLVHSFFQSQSHNYEGYLTYKHKVDNPQAKQVTTKCQQHFLFYDSLNAKDSCDSRFSFFTKQVLPKYTAPGSFGESGNKEPLGHTLIMTSSYFDYVRLRNYFRREKLSFTQICEYTEENKVAKARQLFYFGARQFLIYSERCHFYHRYKIKGIRRIIFYDPPIYSGYYSEMANMLTPELQGKKFKDEDSSQFSVTTLFSNHDTLQLGALVGYSNAVKLIKNKKSLT